MSEPEIPNQRWIKVKNKSCGICVTDIHFIFMEMDPRCFPAGVPGIARKYLGHEMVGEVIQAGHKDFPQQEGNKGHKGGA